MLGPNNTQGMFTYQSTFVYAVHLKGAFIIPELICAMNKGRLLYSFRSCQFPPGTRHYCSRVSGQFRSQDNSISQNNEIPCWQLGVTGLQKGIDMAWSNTNAFPL